MSRNQRDDDNSDTIWAIAFFDLMQNYVVCNVRSQQGEMPE
ncbi:MAG: hypothetical protein V7L11_18330 [Nostoc sp.]